MSREEKIIRAIKKIAEYIAYLQANSNKSNFEIEGQFLREVELVKKDILQDLI